MHLSAVCFTLGCILTLPILDTGGPLGLGLDLSVLSGVVVVAGVVVGISLPLLGCLNA